MPVQPECGLDRIVALHKVQLGVWYATAMWQWGGLWGPDNNLEPAVHGRCCMTVGVPFLIILLFAVATVQ